MKSPALFRQPIKWLVEFQIESSPEALIPRSVFWVLLFAIVNVPDSWYQPHFMAITDCHQNLDSLRGSSSILRLWSPIRGV